MNRRGHTDHELQLRAYCQVCGKPMLAGQRNRHGVCSPRLECCGAYTDLVPDLDKHAKAHAEMDVARK